MKLTPVSCNTNFCRALTSKEEVGFKKTTNEAMKALNVDKGVRMYKVFQTSLPNEKNQNTGIGKLNSKEAFDYLKYMALYTGSNAIKIYPSGEYPRIPRLEHYYCPYERSSTTAGEDNINFYKLTESKYGKLLNESDIEKYRISDENDYVDYENEMIFEDGAEFKLIKKAYFNMQNQNTKEAKKIKKEFESFKKKQKTDSMDRLAIAKYVKEDDPYLFEDFNSFASKRERFEEYKKQYSREIDIYKFGKFIALKNMKEAKEELNKNGLELYGDCPIGFSEDEVYCFSDAFYPENITPGWGFRALKYDEVVQKGTEANRLFTEKLLFNLENYDGIRFDVGWQYFEPKLYDESDNNAGFKINVKDDVIKYIEKTAKEVKGKNYDTRKLMYECDANSDDFTMFNWSNDGAKIKPIMKNRTPVITTVYEHTHQFGWGNPKFLEKTGIEDYMIGAGNHDSTPLRALAEEDFDDKGNEVLELSSIRTKNKGALAESLNVKEGWLEDSKNFIRAKFAEIFQAKNHFVFFNDVMGNNERLDKQGTDTNDYRLKIKSDWEEKYHTALQEGYGFNLADSLALAMKAKNLDKTNPELYGKIKNYSDILYQKGPKTREEADLYINEG